MSKRRYVLFGLIVVAAACVSTALIVNPHWFRSSGTADVRIEVGSAGSQGDGTSEVDGSTFHGAPITLGETIHIASKRLGEERAIRIYLPPSYANSQQLYPVIYTLDGGSTGPVTASAVGFMTGASEIPQMPEALVVAVPNTNRDRDLPGPQEYGEGGEQTFLAFLADELIPVIERRYRTQPLRVLIGHSAGGLFAHYALTARPTLFQWYLPMDAPLFGPARPILEKVRTQITEDPKYRGRLVTIENAYGWQKDWQRLIDASPQHFYGARVEIKDETHETMVYRGIYEGLKRLFHDYAPDVNDAKLELLEAKYSALSEAYGYRVDIPQQVLMRSAARNVLQQYGAEAVKLVQRAEALYGTSAATRRLMAEAEEAVKNGGPDPRVAELLNAPPPDVEKMKPFLGTWAGTMEVPGGVPLDIQLAFAAEGGVVKARCTVTGPDGSPFSVQVAFVRVLEGGVLQWGVRNGRIGINLATATLIDENTLQGTEESVGVPRRPDVTVQPSTFTYKRRLGK